MIPPSQIGMRQPSDLQSIHTLPVVGSLKPAGMRLASSCRIDRHAPGQLTGASSSNTMPRPTHAIPFGMRLHGIPHPVTVTGVCTEHAWPEVTCIYEDQVHR